MAFERVDLIKQPGDGKKKIKKTAGKMNLKAASIQHFCFYVPFKLINDVEHKVLKEIKSDEN